MSAAFEVVTALAGSRKAIQLYPPTHPAHGEALQLLVDAVARATAGSSFVLNLHQGRLYHGSVVLPEDVHGAASISEAFESRRIESLTFQPAFSSSDALGLTEVLSLRPSPELDVEAELAARGVSGVAVCFLEDEEDEERAERDRQRQADKAMYQRVIVALRRMRDQFSGGGTADLGDTVNLVAGVMDRLLSDQAAVLGLATMRGRDDRDLFHSLNVMIYALVLGERLGLPEEGLSSLGMSALLHDIGKTAFDAADPAQAEPMRTMHARVGADILQRCGLEDPAPMLVAYEHHMAPDGTGHPERPADYIAHPYSRMVAIADRYENLTAGGAAITPDKAIVRLLQEGGTVVDPFFARLFANALGAFPIGSLVRLSDHSVGVVVRHGEDPLAPVIRVTFDARGNDAEGSEELDLATTEIRLVEVIHPDDLAVEVGERI